MPAFHRGRPPSRHGAQPRPQHRVRRWDPAVPPHGRDPRPRHRRRDCRGEPAVPLRGLPTDRRCWPSPHAGAILACVISAEVAEWSRPSPHASAILARVRRAEVAKNVPARSPSWRTPQPGRQPRGPAPGGIRDAPTRALSRPGPADAPADLHSPTAPRGKRRGVAASGRRMTGAGGASRGGAGRRGRRRRTNASGGGVVLFLCASGRGGKSGC